MFCSLHAQAGGWIQIGNWPHDVRAASIFSGDPKQFRVVLMLVGKTGNEQPLFPETQLWYTTVPFRWVALPQAVEVPGSNPGDRVTQGRRI
jgi:hypothetical protein